MISRVPQMAALRRQLLSQPDRRTKAVSSWSRFGHKAANHDRAFARSSAACKFFSSQPNKQMPIFESMSTRLDQLIQDSQWFIPRKGSGMSIGCIGLHFYSSVGDKTHAQAYLICSQDSIISFPRIRKRTRKAMQKRQRRMATARKTVTRQRRGQVEPSEPFAPPVVVEVVAVGAVVCRQISVV
jgi:hypothetical protein